MAKVGKLFAECVSSSGLSSWLLSLQFIEWVDYRDVSDGICEMNDLQILFSEGSTL